MPPTAFSRPVAFVLLAIAYASRPLSCSYALSRFSIFDDVPYAQFDRHGISAGYGLIGALVCLYPLLWLARKVIPANDDGAATSPDRGLNAGSAAVALAIAAPSFAQIDYMWALPLTVDWPVIASCVSWAIVVVAMWLRCLRSAHARRAMAAVRHQAFGIALLVTAPKLMILTI